MSKNKLDYLKKYIPKGAQKAQLKKKSKANNQSIYSLDVSANKSKIKIINEELDIRNDIQSEDEEELSEEDKPVIVNMNQSIDYYNYAIGKKNQNSGWTNLENDNRIIDTSIQDTQQPGVQNLNKLKPKTTTSSNTSRSGSSQKEKPRKKRKRHDTDSESEDEEQIRKKKKLEAQISTLPAMKPGLQKGNDKIEGPQKKTTSIQDQYMANQTIYRNKEGKIVDIKSLLKTKKDELIEKNEERLNRWGKGAKQLEDQANQRVYEDRIKNLPLARYEYEKETDQELKQVDRFGDPIKRIQAQKLNNEMNQIPRKKCKFSAPPNRFEIEPGYHWDGVDRSNGFERRLMDVKNKKVANNYESYKWRTEDM